MSNVRFCYDCDYLEPSESKQTKKKEDHMCTLFNVRLFHGRYHPNIIQFKLCHKNTSNGGSNEN